LSALLGCGDAFIESAIIYHRGGGNERSIMKKIPMLPALRLAGALSLCVFGARADSGNNEIHRLAADFETLQQTPGKSIPPDLLSNAQGIVLLDRTKAGFLFAYEGGGGVAMVRNASGHWSPPAFLTANQASLGFQIGGEQNFFVILLMTTNAAHDLTASLVDLGGEARGTAGDQSAGAEGQAISKDSVVVYNNRVGLYGGVAIKGGAISPDEKANETYYGQFVTMNDILFRGKVKPTAAATDLAKTLSQYSHK